jgi:hypothetical protein
MGVAFFIISATAPIWLLGIAVYYFVTAPRRERTQRILPVYWRVALWLAAFACLVIVPALLNRGGLETVVRRQRLGLPPIPTVSKLIYTFTSYLLVAVMLARSRHKRSAIVGWYFYTLLLISATVGAMWFYE